MPQTENAAPTRRKPVWWRPFKRILTIAFLAVVAWLIFRYARTIDWHAVWAATLKIDRSTLLLGAACSAASYLVYSCIDLFARAAMQHKVPVIRSMAIAFVCYAFNLNFGSWVGSIGFRYRLYSRYGLGPEQVTRIVGTSLFTNWSGYFLLAGIAFTFGFVSTPPGWELGHLGLQVAGAFLLITVFAYLAVSALSPKRTWTLRGHELGLPSLRVALLQVFVSGLNWILIVMILWVLLREHVDFQTVLGTFLLASIAGAAAHIPAGLGVVEAVFFGVLGGMAPHSELLAALLAFRALYYLAPLVVAAPIYLLLEAQGKNSKSAPKAQPASN